MGGDLGTSTKFHRMGGLRRRPPRSVAQGAWGSPKEGSRDRGTWPSSPAPGTCTGIRIGAKKARAQERLPRPYHHPPRPANVKFGDEAISFHFRGKGGQVHEVGLADPGLTAILQDCYEIPGHELFQYLDEEGRRHAITPGDVNDHLREISGGDFTAKDFRTWVGSIQALLALEELPVAGSEAQLRRNVNQMLDLVSEQLRNTRSVCRDFYVHPVLVEGYLEGRTQRLLEGLEVPRIRELRRAERRFLALLRFLRDEPPGSP